MAEASCHCGAVTLDVPAPTGALTDCNCSICRRLGALWAYYNTEDVTLTGGAKALVSYGWQNHAIAFHHCRICGCTTHYTSGGASAADRTAINARILDPQLIANLPIRHFDGADSWRYIDS